MIFFYGSGDNRDLHVLTHSFPPRRSSDLGGAGLAGLGTAGDQQPPSGAQQIGFGEAVHRDDARPFAAVGTRDRDPRLAACDLVIAADRNRQPLAGADDLVFGEAVRLLARRFTAASLAPDPAQRIARPARK